ncbi:MAG: 3-isopropylmalate dehydratase large subunit, partial [Clostridia bacterium]|nr:3-isopropylmalate dehydratase large subunit [Clostridia bacterium]
IRPGDAVIGADSHTCTYGALGAFSTGVGSTDLAVALRSGKCWFRIPEAIGFKLTGRLPGNCSGKDLILYIIGMIGVDGALYRSMEFYGEGVSSLSIDDRFTVCNMAVEAGAKNGLFVVDNVTVEYLAAAGAEIDGSAVLSAGNICEEAYEKIIEIDLDKLVPMVALPHKPSNAVPVSELERIDIDQIVIGSCTNGRISDLRIAAEVLKGKKVAPYVRCIVIPGTPKIYKEALDEGLIGIFLDAGAAVSTPTCGPCLGGHMGVLAENEKCVSTTNRNFVGRMGHITSQVFLTSPLTAAQAAVNGFIGREGV